MPVEGRLTQEESRIAARGYPGFYYFVWLGAEPYFFLPLWKRDLRFPCWDFLGRGWLSAGGSSGGLCIHS